MGMITDLLKNGRNMDEDELFDNWFIDEDIEEYVEDIWDKGSIEMEIE